jgi:hypothetical protein
MKQPIQYNNRYLDDLEYVVLNEPPVAYSLFENVLSASGVQNEQLSIFNILSKKLPFSSASAFCNQVHFRQAYQIPVQRWFPYREGYSIKLVNAFINELGITGNVFDPFVGSGTTLLASRNKNLQSFGIDINPISVLVSKVENEQYTKEEIKLLSEEIKAIQSLQQKNKSYTATFDLAEKMFNTDILQTVLYFKHYILQIENAKIRNLIFVAWLSIIEEVSNVKKEGNGIKYKNRKRTQSGYINIKKEDWEEKYFPSDKFFFVKSKILQKLDMFLVDIRNHFGNSEKLPKIFQNDCLNFEDNFSDEIQFTFFSPPYCNCFDYFEIHKVELWLGDFVKNKEDFKLLRNSGFRSNTNSLSGKPVKYKNDYLERLITLFDVEKLWSNKIPNVVRGYFDDAHTLLKKIYHHTPKNGYVGIVVGNSAYSGIIIPSDIIIADMAKEIGYDVDNIFITRHLTTSSQQKRELEPLKEYLRESIVLLKK